MAATKRRAKKEEFNYSSAMKEVKSIIAELEDFDTDVDKIAERVERATSLLKQCKAKLLKTSETVDTLLEEKS